jgi:hypothetical protein
MAVANDPIVANLELDEALLAIRTAARKVGHVSAHREVMPADEAWVVLGEAQILIGDATRRLAPALAALQSAPPSGEHPDPDTETTT